VDHVILYYYTFDMNFPFYYDICSVKVFTEQHLKMAKWVWNMLCYGRKKADINNKVVACDGSLYIHKELYMLISRGKCSSPNKMGEICILNKD
jgi:hypothetical protein